MRTETEINGVKATDKAADYSFQLRADSGYTSESEGHRISAEQFGRINRILEEAASPPPPAPMEAERIAQWFDARPSIELQGMAIADLIRELAASTPTPPTAEPRRLREPDDQAYEDLGLPPEAAPPPAASVAGQGAETAKQRYDEIMAECPDGGPLENLRFFCSLAMNGQDWLDVEPLFDALAAPAVAEPTADAKDAALTDQQRGAIAYQLTKRLVIDMPTARAAVDAALKD